MAANTVDLASLGFSTNRLDPKDYPKDNVELRANAGQVLDLFIVKDGNIVEGKYAPKVRTARYRTWADHCLACAMELRSRTPKSPAVA
jgi:hypothetical protein